MVRKLKPMVKVPLEKNEQEVLAAWLDREGYIWCHVPNEIPSVHGKPNYAWMISMRRRGLKPGIPDVLIFVNQSIPLRIAIELKREKGGATSDKQKQWIINLRECGWHAEVCCGLQNAIMTIQNLTILQGIING